MIECKICNKQKKEDEFYKKQKTKCKNCFNRIRRKVSYCRECKKGYLSQKKGKGRFCSLICRFMNKVEKMEKCWIWKGGKNKNQWGKKYGTFQMEDKLMLAHRVSYEIFKEKIPEEKLVCHSCDVELCVNPSHLWLGTYKDNMEDMRKKGRGNFYKGEESPGAKLTEKEIEEIKDLRNGGMMIKDIALLYNVTRHAIQNILSGRSWRSK